MSIITALLVLNARRHVKPDLLFSAHVLSVVRIRGL